MKSTHSGFLARTVVGFVILSGVLACLLGPGTLLILLVLSVVCTYGAGILPLIGISYLVGTAADMLLERRRRSKIESKLKDLSPDMKALVLYVNVARKSGLDDGMIRRNLLDNGWGDEFITEAFGMV